jgi:hypothetical protein
LPSGQGIVARSLSASIKSGSANMNKSKKALTKNDNVPLDKCFTAYFTSTAA